MFMSRSSICLLVQCSFKWRVNLGCELGSGSFTRVSLGTKILFDFSSLGKLWGNPLHPHIYVVALVDQVCMHLVQEKK